VTNPEYLDVTLPESTEFVHPSIKGHSVFAFVFDGTGYFDHTEESEITTGAIALYGDGDFVRINTRNTPVRFLLVSGKPIKEPVAWRGPIVMNTDEELRIAFSEYRNGTFIKNK
jgi:redox-sensitive bicupin YhaK (pirin superfamily)